MAADKIQVDYSAMLTILPCAACQCTAYVGVFSGKIVLAGQMWLSVRTTKVFQSIFSFLVVGDDIWLSWTAGQALLRTLVLGRLIILPDPLFVFLHL